MRTFALFPPSPTMVYRQPTGADVPPRLRGRNAKARWKMRRKLGHRRTH